MSFCQIKILCLGFLGKLLWLDRCISACSWDSSNYLGYEEEVPLVLFTINIELSGSEISHLTVVYLFIQLVLPISPKGGLPSLGSYHHNLADKIFSHQTILQMPLQYPYPIFPLCSDLTVKEMFSCIKQSSQADKALELVKLTAEYGIQSTSALAKTTLEEFELSEEQR